MRFCIFVVVAAAGVVLCASAANAQATSTTNASGEWSGPRPSVTYLPAVDLTAGGGYEVVGGHHRVQPEGRLALGVHRLSTSTLLTLAPEGGREGQRWVMGMDAELIHLRSGLGLQMASLRDLSSDRWGGRGALVLSYLRAGVTWYDGGRQEFSLTVRVPLTLLGAWFFGGL
jgi:hypothetical protein